MLGSDPGSAREEAERLVAAVLATAKLAAAGPGVARAFGALGDAVLGAVGGARHADETGGGMATGAPECCVCPLCRLIGALRDPSPEFAERLATGAGDFAAGLASLLRAFGAPAGDEPRPAEPAATTPDPRASGDEAGRAAPRAEARPATAPTDPDEVWAAATADSAAPAAGGAAADTSGGVPADKSGGAAPRPGGARPMARKAVKRPVRTGASGEANAGGARRDGEPAGGARRGNGAAGDGAGSGNGA